MLQKVHKTIRHVRMLRTKCAGQRISQFIGSRSNVGGNQANVVTPTNPHNVSQDRAQTAAFGIHGAQHSHRCLIITKHPHRFVSKFCCQQFQREVHCTQFKSRNVLLIQRSVPHICQVMVVQITTPTRLASVSKHNFLWPHRRNGRPNILRRHMQKIMFKLAHGAACKAGMYMWSPVRWCGMQTIIKWQQVKPCIR